MTSGLRLAEAARALAEAGDLEQLLPKLLAAALDLSGAQRGYVAVGPRTYAHPDPALRPSRSILDVAASAGHPVVLADALGDPVLARAESVAGQRVRAVAAVPLRRGEETVGVLVVDHAEHPGVFGPAELQALEAVASMAALLVRGAGLEAELDRAATPRAPAAVEAPSIAGRGRAIRAVLDLVARVRGVPYPVHLCGESGTGKELVARSLHAGGPFVPVNCGAIPDTLAESACFGHVRGAFTGADRDQAGFFELADGGTLFLDEAEAMSPSLQEKLLRVLQDGEVRRVGSRAARAVRVRVVSASNRDLGALADEGRFRSDLLYRLDVLRIDVPPLRDRREDIPDLVERFRADFARETGRPAPRVSFAALRLLQSHDWPGNVRQLQNAVRQAASLARGPVLSDSDFSFLARAGRVAAEVPLMPVEEYIRRAVEGAEGRLPFAEIARRLGMSRKTLWAARKRWGLG